MSIRPLWQHFTFICPLPSHVSFWLADQTGLDREAFCFVVTRVFPQAIRKDQVEGRRGWDSPGLAGVA